MSRLRERNDYFEWRGDRYAFHQLVDGPVLARLDPDSDDEQIWTLHSRRVISPTGAEVRDIAKQVHGVDLPERVAGASVVRVRDDGLADRVSVLEARVAALEAREPAVVEKIVEVEKIVHVEVPAPVVEPDPPPAPYVPDFTLIPDALAKYAEADESAEDFRKRAFSILFRFGIAEGENFEGGGEPLSPEEKIRLLPMLIANFAAGNWLNLTEDLKP